MQREHDSCIPSFRQQPGKKQARLRMSLGRQANPRSETSTDVTPKFYEDFCGFMPDSGCRKPLRFRPNAGSGCSRNFTMAPVDHASVHAPQLMMSSFDVLLRYPVFPDALKRDAWAMTYSVVL